MRGIKRIVLVLTCFFMGAIAVIPLLALLQVGLNDPASIAKNGILSTPVPTIENLVNAWNHSSLGPAMLNSLFITVSAVTLTVFFSASAAYAIARFPNRFHKTVYYVLIFSMAIPTIISTVPLYFEMRLFGAINKLWGIVLLNTTGSLPFAVFLYTSFIKATPADMEEAARIDGCSQFMAFWRILFPILKPVTSTVILLNAVNFWNEYGRSVFFLQKKEKYTLSLAISTFVQKFGARWELMAGAAIIAMIPAVVIFLFFQKYFIKGLAAGAVKG